MKLLPGLITTDDDDYDDDDDYCDTIDNAAANRNDANDIVVIVARATAIDSVCPRAPEQPMDLDDTAIVSSSTESELDVPAKPARKKRKLAPAKRSPKAASRGASAKPPSAADEYNAYLRSALNNRRLLDALVITRPDQLVAMASQNVQNYGDLALLEWSECVLIQLCTLKQHAVVTEFLWAQLEAAIAYNQWSMEVVHNIRTYISPNRTLLDILTKNHQYKVARHKLDPNLAFVTRPLVNYAVLQAYKLTLDVITRPLHQISRLPMTFRKMRPQKQQQPQPVSPSRL